MKILNFGSLNIDYTYLVDRFVRPGETKTSRGLMTGAGGKGLNQSIALAMAGAPVYHAGVIGQGGAFLRETLVDCGVDCSFIKELKLPNGHAIIQLEDGGQNCILLYPGTNRQLSASFIDQVLSHFCEEDILLLQNETNAVPSLIEKAVAKGMRVAFNAAPMTEAVRNYPLDKLSWLLVNETEGAALTGETEPDKIANAIAEKYPELALVLTLGTDGAIYRKGELSLYVPARRVQAVDTTGAGDSFTGYFLAAIADGSDAAYALTFATTAASLTVQRPGAASSIPALEEVLKAM